MSTLDIANMANCIADVRLAALNTDPGPADPTEYHPLRGRLVTARTQLPPLYRKTLFDPYVATLDNLGENGFIRILLSDPQRERLAGLMLDMAHAILQNGEGFEAKATDAFQEVVSGLYDGFLSAEDRLGVQPPDRTVIPPLVKWGNPAFGPYTFTSEATANFGAQPGIVSLPPANARRALLAWAALGHETAGHDILGADVGLRGELERAVFKALDDAGIGNGLPEYWSARIDETASDVMGILNMGPAAGIGLIGYFRGLNAAFTGVPQLRNRGPANDSHPADIVRGFLAAATVRLLRFADRNSWADLILQETSNDVTAIRLAGITITEQLARQSADIVAAAIAMTKVSSLENRALSEIQNWRDVDEEIVRELSSLLVSPLGVPERLVSGFYAAHVIAAVVVGALQQNADLPTLFGRMLDILKKMHDSNPSWGPLFVVHPGNLAAHRVYEKFEAERAESPVELEGPTEPARPSPRRRR